MSKTIYLIDKLNQTPPSNRAEPAPLTDEDNQAWNDYFKGLSELNTWRHN